MESCVLCGWGPETSLKFHNAGDCRPTYLPARTTVDNETLLHEA